MPLNVRRYSTSAFGFFLISAVFGLTAVAQIAPVASIATPPVMGPPTSGDIMRDRISKSKAYIAVRNYNAAIYELENIRKESGDTAVQGVVSVLLMNSYLEQGDYKRAQDLLNEFYAAQKTAKPNAADSYAAVAAQVTKGARSRAERYKALGLSVSDRTLPLEALNDLEKIRETLELVITQSKEVAAKKERPDEAMAMLEEASRSRAMLARDDYDSRRWTEEVADTRETMANGGSVVRNAVAGVPELMAVNGTTPAKPLAVPGVTLPAPTSAQPANSPVYQPTQMSGQINTAVVPPVTQPVAVPAQSVNPTTPPANPVTQPANPVSQPPVEVPVSQPVREREVKIIGSAPPTVLTAATDKPAADTNKPAETVAEVKPEAAPVTTDAAKTEGPLAVGLLMPYATNQARPVYPAAARTIRQTGMVKVEVTIDEDGTVSGVQKVSGPMMLQGAAKDAILKWRFKPFTRDGQPVKATGFVNFNFAL